MKEGEIRIMGMTQALVEITAVASSRIPIQDIASLFTLETKSVCLLGGDYMWIGWEFEGWEVRLSVIQPDGQRTNNRKTQERLLLSLARSVNTELIPSSQLMRRPNKSLSTLAAQWIVQIVWMVFSLRPKKREGGWGAELSNKKQTVKRENRRRNRNHRKRRD